MRIQLGSSCSEVKRFQHMKPITIWRKSYASSCRHLIKPKAEAHDTVGTSALQSNIVLFPRGVLDARQVFDKMPHLSVVSATAMIGRCARQHHHEVALYLFSAMFVLNVRPNEFTFGTVIHSATALGDIDIGKQLHACAKKMGIHSNVFVGSALLDLYAKWSVIEEAQRAFDDINMPNVVSYTSLISGYLKLERIQDALQLFDEMPERNVVSWNAIIGGFSQKGHNEDAVHLFIDMLREGFLPTQSTFPCAICAAANIASLGMGRSFHACAVKFLGKLDVFVSNSLISLYAKCGSVEDSLLVFNKLDERNIVSWNAVLCGYAQNGRGKEGISFYERMSFAGCKPNGVTVLSLLWACNHGGLIDEGYSYFNQVRLNDPSMLKPEHYACMVDLLSRSGQFRRAEEFIRELPFDPGIGFWKALLGGCQIHSNVELGELAAERIEALEPDDVSSYVMMSNAHSAAGKWQSVSTVRREMKEKGLKRIPGCSWIEIRSKVHVFVTGDRNHHQKDEIYSAVRFLVEQLKESEDFNFLSDSRMEINLLTIW